MVKKKLSTKAGSPAASRSRRRLSIAEAVRVASEQVGFSEGDDQYLRNARVAARALQLLLPDRTIDEDNVEFGVAFEWPNVPSPTRLVRSYLEEQRALELSVNATPTQRRMPTVQPFVYGVVEGQLVVLPKSVAEKWARLNRAMATCSTWGEARRVAPPDLYREAIDILGRRRMPAARALDADLEELAEEGFPPPAGQIMRHHLPAQLDYLFEIARSALGEEIPQLPEVALPQVPATFSSLGVPCVEDTVLIAAAAGYQTDDRWELLR